MSQKSGSLSIHSETYQLAAYAATHGHALSDDLYNVIRAIVPPPLGHVETCPIIAGSKEMSNQHSAVSEGLFTRRPTEESLLEKVYDKSSSPKEALINLEEIFIQLVEPHKYSHVDEVVHSVSYLMQKWPNDEAVQEQALNCLECLIQQCNDLRPSQTAVSPILQAMKVFRKNEMLQRMGVKLLKHKNFLHWVEKKIEVAELILSSLCKLPEVDDFVLHAKDIVGKLAPSEKALIRSCKPYIEMLLDFPNRKNDKITIYLSWTALDILASLADFDEKWDVLINADGEAKLFKLAHRPELEDRCKALLGKVFPTVSKTTMKKNNMDDFCLVSAVPVNSAKQSSIEKQKINTYDHSSWTTAVIQKQPNSTKAQNGQLSSLRMKTVLSLPPDGCIIPVLPVDELITRNPPTPPPTIADMDDDHDGRFSDDDAHLMQSPYTPFASPSPSYSPPQEDHFGEPQSPNRSMENGSIQTKTIENVTIQHGRHNTTKSVSNQNIMQCFICNEPKGKRPLLSMQLKQISHCLQKPSNVLLFNCLEANLCKDHKI